AFNEILESAHFIGGFKNWEFEKAFSEFVGAPYCIGVSSGNSALELLFKALGLGSGGDVIFPANSFFVNSGAVRNVGARPIFADVDVRTFHIDVASCERVITPHTRAIIPVHFYGWALDMAPIEHFAAKHNLFIVEDAAQAHGVARNGRRVGSSGRLTCF